MPARVVQAISSFYDTGGRMFSPREWQSSLGQRWDEFSLDM